jgi:hypothetical protein
MVVQSLQFTVDALSSDGSLGDLSLDDDDGLGFSDENEE